MIMVNLDLKGLTITLCLSVIFLGILTGGCTPEPRAAAAASTSAAARGGDERASAGQGRVPLTLPKSTTTTHTKSLPQSYQSTTSLRHQHSS